jgi:putative flippase GtrA
VRQFALFCVAGTIGFVVDAGLVQALVAGAGFDPYASRVVSFLCAMTATWIFNRRYTFARQRGESLLHEWARYGLAMLGGFAVNYGVYALMVWQLPLVREWPVLGVAAGSIFGLAVNYASSRLWVFRS